MCSSSKLLFKWVCMRNISYVIDYVFGFVFCLIILLYELVICVNFKGCVNLYVFIRYRFLMVFYFIFIRNVINRINEFVFCYKKYYIRGFYIFYFLIIEYCKIL